MRFEQNPKFGHASRYKPFKKGRSGKQGAALRHTLDDVAHQQMSRVLGTEEKDEEETKEPMLGRSNSRNGLSSPGS